MRTFSRLELCVPVLASALGAHLQFLLENAQLMPKIALCRRLWDHSILLGMGWRESCTVFRRLSNCFLLFISDLGSANSSVNSFLYCSLSNPDQNQNEFLRGVIMPRAVVTWSNCVSVPFDDPYDAGRLLDSRKNMKPHWVSCFALWNCAARGRNQKLNSMWCVIVQTLESTLYWFTQIYASYFTEESNSGPRNIRTSVTVFIILIV